MSKITRCCSECGARWKHVPGPLKGLSKQELLDILEVSDTATLYLPQDIPGKLAVIESLMYTWVLDEDQDGA